MSDPLPLPAIINEYPPEIQEQIHNYLQEMDVYQRKAYLIAIDHLGSTFDILRSNGFSEWRESRKSA